MTELSLDEQAVRVIAYSLWEQEADPTVVIWSLGS
jgi:hypothetical protein